MRRCLTLLATVAAAGLVGCGSGSAGGQAANPAFARMTVGQGTSPTTGAIAGSVTDAAGSPVAQAAVVVTTGGTGRAAGQGSFSVTTDALGHFAIGNMTPGRYHVDATHDAYGGMSEDVVVSAGQNHDMGAMHMAPTGQSGMGGGAMGPQPDGASAGSGMGIILGLVTHDDDMPFEGVTLTTGNGHFTATGPDGLFALGNLPPGHYDVTASGAEHHDVMLSADVTGQQVAGPLHFMMLDGQGAAVPGSASLAGQVINAATHAAVAGAQVSVMAGTPVTSMADGTFALAGVRPGMRMLRVTASGYLPYAQPVMLQNGDALTDVVVALDTVPASASATGTIHAMVTDSVSGLPIGGAAVQIDNRRPFHTGADGTATITGVPAGAHAVRIGARRHLMHEEQVTVLADQTVHVPAAPQPATDLQVGDGHGPMGHGGGGGGGMGGMRH
ncbi:MAG: carboxypeptidase regulatory-like domain-containing protein [Armatimonadetes bacterium]|nr:carboxypeptidase regulatory-like domain-containing protein [Armatimonadota bacterium]